METTRQGSSTAIDEPLISVRYRLRQGTTLITALICSLGLPIEAAAQGYSSPYYGGQGNVYPNSQYMSAYSGFSGAGANVNTFSNGFSNLNPNPQPQTQNRSYQQTAPSMQQSRMPAGQYASPAPSYQPKRRPAMPQAIPVGQGHSMAALENLLDTVDASTNWNRVQTVMAPQPQQTAQVPAQQSVPAGTFPKLSRQEMTRIFLEGGYPQDSSMQGAYGGAGGSAFGGSAFSGASAFGGGGGSNSGATSTAYSNYQTAQNEATRARNYANTARYDSSKWNRKNAASQAEYAANNANYAAQRAESAAYSGDSQARSYASLARQAANRARASANQARYNADTIQ